jgi:hypothetical protein
VHDTDCGRDRQDGKITIYGWSTRAGLDVPLTIDLHRAGGFTGPITIRVSSGYLQIFDVEGFSPEPASQSADEDHLYWTFSPPPAGEDFRLDLNASVMSSSQLRSTGEIAVVVDGAPAVTVDTETWLALMEIVSLFQPGRIGGRSDRFEGVPAPARRLDRRSRHCARPVRCPATVGLTCEDVRLEKAHCARPVRCPATVGLTCEDVRLEKAQ